MKCKKLFTVLCLCGISFISLAQDFGDEVTYSELSSDSAYEESDFLPAILDENVINLLERWHVQYFSNAIDYCLDDDANVFFPHEVYSDRLSKLPTIIPMEYNQLVRAQIDFYANRRRNQVRYMLGMADMYFPIFEQILEQYDMPLELKYLPIMESALNPKALSRVGAAGLWQFMLPAAKIYGLEVNSLIDERLDPVQATHAACKYLKDSYATFGDWHLAIASYNCGVGGVNKAIRRSGGKTNFWEIYPYLPRETRSFVPIFIAVTYIMNYHCEHNLCPVKTSLSMATDTIMVHNRLHFQQVADILNLDIEYIRMLNPQYKREIIPGNIRPSILKLPVAATFEFIDKEDTLYQHRIDELLAHCQPVYRDSTGKDLTRETIRHTVVSGENLVTIANRYGVTAANLRQWNGLRSNSVAAGRRLTVHINNGGITYAAVPVPVPENAAPANASSNSGAKTVTYTVQAGDTLLAISRKYPGTTVARIQTANQMTSDRLSIGQVLKIPPE